MVSELSRLPGSLRSLSPPSCSSSWTAGICSAAPSIVAAAADTMPAWTWVSSSFSSSSCPFSSSPSSSSSSRSPPLAAAAPFGSQPAAPARKRPRRVAPTMPLVAAAAAVAGLSARALANVLLTGDRNALGSLLAGEGVGAGSGHLAPGIPASLLAQDGLGPSFVVPGIQARTDFFDSELPGGAPSGATRTARSTPSSLATSASSSASAFAAASSPAGPIALSSGSSRTSFLGTRREAKEATQPGAPDAQGSAWSSFCLGGSALLALGASTARALRRRSTPIVRRSLGVPKVAYRLPGTASAEWVDIYSRLYRERILFLGKEITDQSANEIIGVLLYLEAEDPEKPIYLYINSVGGSVLAGLAIYDTMKHIKSPVVTLNLGLAASTASFLLAAGDKRLALPHSRTMIHQAAGGAQGQAEDIRIESEQILTIHESVVNAYSKMTGQPIDKIREDLQRDFFMSAHEAKEYGLIDEVIELDDPAGK